MGVAILDSKYFSDFSCVFPELLDTDTNSNVNSNGPLFYTNYSILKLSPYIIGHVCIHLAENIVFHVLTFDCPCPFCFRWNKIGPRYREVK